MVLEVPVEGTPYRKLRNKKGVHTRHSSLAHLRPAVSLMKYLRIEGLELWLEDEYDYLSRYANIQHLKITLRRGDWHRWELDLPIVFDPRCAPGSSKHDMLKVWRRAGRGQDVPFPEDSWAHMLGKFRFLQTFVLELETTKEREGELRAIIVQAQKWIFPIEGTGHSLRTAYRQPEWRYWTGPRCLNALLREDEPEGPEMVVAKVFYELAKIKE